MQPPGEASAPIVANDPENAPVGQDPAIDSLEGRIASARKLESDRMSQEHAPMRSGAGMAIQVASTMLGYPLGGFIIGLVLDNLFDTLPWISISLMFLAFAGACMHVVRMSKDRAR